MKIVKRGQPPADRKFRGECPNCKSVMEEVASALNVESDYRSDGEFAHATCPVCEADFCLYPYTPPGGR